MPVILAPLAVMFSLFQVLWEIFKKPKYRAVSKIFTIAYIFIGFSVFVSFAGMLTQERIEIHRNRQSNNDGTDQ
jgi:hypothetical protein